MKQTFNKVAMWVLDLSPKTALGKIIWLNVRSGLVCLVIWVSITSFYQAVMSPEMTQMEVFLNIPNSFILNFK